MKGDKKNILIYGLVAIIVILLLLVIYNFVIQPALNGLVVKGQTQGYNYAISALVQQVSSCNQVPIDVGNNQTINIIAVECLQQSK